MNERQSHLLRLLKEIDSFCREHDITYYCAAGTVLGAIRHGGFIPWDDDIDILMTRSELCRFTEEFRKYGRKDRTIEFYEGDHEHHSTVARYLQEGTSMFCHYHITGYASAGILIDIFILDPIPDGQDARDEYLAKFFAYADLIAPTLSYSNRLPEKYSHLIDDYEKQIASEGFDKVIAGLTEDLFSYEEKDCSRLILRWGSTPFIYPKEFFGQPEYMDFADMSIPVPAKWPLYLATHYGSRWTDIPYVSGQAQHTSVFSPDVDYHELYSLRDEMFDQEELERLHHDMKVSRRKSDRLARQLEGYASDIRIRLCMEEIGVRLKKTGCGSAAELFDSGRYKELTDVYKPYLDLQTDIYFTGATKHGAMYHWLFPTPVPLDNETLAYVIRSLLYTRRLNTAEKLIGIYDRAGMLTGDLLNIRELISDIQAAAGLYYSGEYSRALSFIAGIRDHEHYPDLMDLYWLAKVHTGITDEETSMLADISAGDNSSPALRKAYADLLWAQGSRSAAEEIYSGVMSSCRNGMFLKDIRDKGITSAELMSEQGNASSGHDNSMCRARLLSEIAEICEKNDIPYILGEELTGAVLNNGSFIPDGVSAEILMTADSAARFSEICSSEETLPSERKLMSWKTGDRTGGFSLFYADTGTVSCDLRDPRGWQDLYIGITIRIIRASSPRSLQGRLSRIGETFVSIMDSYGDGKPQYTGKGLRGSVIRLISGMTPERKSHWRMRIFNDSVRRDASSGSRYYYYAAGSGISPSAHVLPENVINDVTELAFDGRTYCASTAFVQAAAGSDSGRKASRKPVFIVESPFVSPDDLFTDADKKLHGELPWRKSAKANKKTSSYDKEVRKVWNKMRDTALERCK